jgi:hypothetical protein
MTIRRLRFAVGAALLLGTPACGDDDVPIGCNPCDGGGFDAAWLDAGARDAGAAEPPDASADVDDADTDVDATTGSGGES